MMCGGRYAYEFCQERVNVIDSGQEQKSTCPDANVGFTYGTRTHGHVRNPTRPSMLCALGSENTSQSSAEHSCDVSVFQTTLPDHKLSTILF